MEKNHIKLNNSYTKQELDFLNYYKGLSKCEFDYFRFIIVTSNNELERNNVISFFEGLLDNLLCLDIDNGYLIIYNNKYHVSFNDYYDSIRFDVGFTFKFFEGFKIKSINYESINNIVNLYYKYINDLSDEYYTIRDIIINCNDIYELQMIKLVLLDKYINDQYFKDFAFGLFDNDLNVSKTASALYMHRNTINNKLDNIYNDTSLKLQKFNDAIALFKLLNLKK